MLAISFGSSTGSQTLIFPTSRWEAGWGESRRTETARISSGGLSKLWNKFTPFTASGASGWVPTIRKYWVRTDDLEPAPVEAVEVEQPTAIITRPLSADNQEDRISMVFGLTSDDPLPDDSEATEMIYFNYLKTHLTFPFPARFFDPIKSCKHEVTVLGMCDDFPLEDGFGAVCDVLAEGEKEQMPLSELEVEPGRSQFPVGE